LFEVRAPSRCVRVLVERSFLGFVMVVDALAAPLLRVELFQGLKATQLAAISRAAERIVYRAGDQITQSGQPADAAVLIVAGSAEWLDATAEEIEIGSLIGEMAMFVEHTYGATIVAKSQVRCLKLPRAAMQDLLLKDEDLAQQFTSRISARLARVARELRAIDEVVLEIGPERRQIAAPTEQAQTH
jgi:signal-transduction protein with cAMP-binding, CBS, and nucleotidyltransferase domain